MNLIAELIHATFGKLGRQTCMETINLANQVGNRTQIKEKKGEQIFNEYMIDTKLVDPS